MSSAVSPVFAIVAERYRDPWDDWTGDAVPHELKHVVRLSDIAQMSPELERVISRVVPQIRGARFGDFFLREIDGLFWATTPEEFEKKAIRFTVLPVSGPQRARCGVTNRERWNGCTTTGAANCYPACRESWSIVGMRESSAFVCSRARPAAW